MNAEYHMTLSEYRVFCEILKNLFPEITRYHSVLPKDYIRPCFFFKVPEKIMKTEDITKSFVKIHKTFEFDFYFVQSDVEAAFFCKDKLTVSLLDNKKFALADSEQFLSIGNITVEADYEKECMVFQIETERTVGRSEKRADFKINQIVNELKVN